MKSIHEKYMEVRKEKLQMINEPVKYNRELWQQTIEAMKRVEGIKEKRQAHHIKERQKKARAIERMKDIKEVKRDLALIKSPAAGMKRQAKDMEVDMDEEVEELDTSLNVKDLKAKSKSSPRKKVAKIITEVEADAEMEEN